MLSLEFLQNKFATIPPSHLLTGYYLLPPHCFHSSSTVRLFIILVIVFTPYSLTAYFRKYISASMFASDKLIATSVFNSVFLAIYLHVGFVIQQNDVWRKFWQMREMSHELAQSDMHTHIYSHRWNSHTHARINNSLAFHLQSLLYVWMQLQRIYVFDGLCASKYTFVILQLVLLTFFLLFSTSQIHTICFCISALFAFE